MDFLHPQFDGLLGDIHTLHYRPKEDAMKYHYQLIKDYARNDIDIMSHCAKEEDVAQNDSQKGDHDSDDRESDKEEAKFGVFMVIEAEKASIVSNVDFKLEEALVEAITGIGDLHVLSSESDHFGGHSAAMILLHEGYIISRAWPNLQYCAFDVVVWSRFHMLDSTRGALLQAVGVLDELSGPSYRVIIGGMHNGKDTTSAWKEDRSKVGPKKANILDCTPEGRAETADAEYAPHRSEARIEKTDEMQSASGIAIQESLALLPPLVASDDSTVSVVFCGIKKSEHECESLTAISASSLQNIITIWACPKYSLEEESKIVNVQLDNRQVTLCGNQIDHALRDITSRHGKLRLVAIDANVPATSVIDIANAITRVPLDLDESLLGEEALVILPKLNQIGKYFLEICRLNLFQDLLRVAIVSLGNAPNETSEDHQIGYITHGNPQFLAQLVKVLEGISKRSKVDANLLTMKSSTVQPQSSFSPHHYTMFDYDEAPGMKQYSEQMPMGKQTLLQMKCRGAVMTAEFLKERAESFLMSMNLTVSEPSFRQVGAGIILYAIFIDGHLAITWNGRQSIDVNVFTYNEMIPHKDLFEEFFMKPIGTKSILTLWEEQPRGVNNVVNFSKDLVAIPGCVDRFILCDKLSELGECDRESERRWMSLNCPLACNICPAREGVA